VRYYLENAVELAESAQYVPAPQEALDEALTKVEGAASGGGTTTG
jgi:hypothetical protein